jgi:hypothetical protein
MHHALRHAGVKHARLIGFDSFQGFPKEAEHQGWEPGASASSLPATVRYLKKKGVPREAMNFVKGWYADTLTAQTKARLKLNKVSLVMIDCDIYTASYDALCFCAPLIADKAVIFFDDWGWRADIGEIGQKEAFEEFLWGLPGIFCTAAAVLSRSGTRVLGHAARSRTGNGSPLRGFLCRMPGVKQCLAIEWPLNEPGVRLGAGGSSPGHPED